MKLITNLHSAMKSIKKTVSYNFQGYKINVPNWLLSKLNHFNTPLVETGSIAVLEEVFPYYKSKVEYNSSISAADVKDSDETEVNVYCRQKFVNLSKPKVLNNLLNEMYLTITKDSFVNRLHLDLDFAFSVLPKNTTSCYPIYRKKGCSEAISDSSKRIYHFLNLNNVLKQIKFLREHPTTIFHRFTPKVKAIGKDKNHFVNKFKIRQIFGVPQFITCLEVMSMFDFVDKFKSVFSVYHTIGLDNPSKSDKIQEVRRFAQLNNKLIFCGDIKSCDKSVPATMVDLFFAFVLACTESDGAYNVVLVLHHYFRHTPIFKSDGKVVYSNGSTTSGSWVTTIFTTFVVFVSLQYSFYLLYGRFAKEGELLLQGDDFLLILDKEYDSVLLKRYLKEFNLRLRLDASRVCSYREDVEFLGYFWNFIGQPDQTDLWFISRIAFPEKYCKISGPERIYTRIFSILLNSIRFKSLFSKFMDADLYLRRKIRMGILEFKFINTQGDLTIQRFDLIKCFDLGWKIL